jgi:peptidyl-prolyl cis-trans isomerase SurA
MKGVRSQKTEVRRQETEDRSHKTEDRSQKAERRVQKAACLLLTAFCCLLRGEIIDRIAISVGNQVVTEGQVDEEIRLTAFLNHEKLTLSSAERKNAAGRLIEQALVKRDLDLSRYPLPAPSEAEASLRDVKLSYAPESLYQQMLKEYVITEAGLKKRLLWQLTLLRFIDYRFRPGIQIPEADVKAYYDQELVKWKQQGIQPVPTFEDSRAKIEEILTERRVDQALDTWMAETRKQVAINYLDESLK